MTMRNRPTEAILAPFKPLAWQIPAWKDKTFTQLLTGSAGGGKSRLAAEKLHGYLLKYPGANGVMLRKTRDSVLNSIVLFYDNLIVGDDPRVKWKPTYNRFEYDNGSMLMYGGMKNRDQREQIRSFGLEGGLDIVWLEEATSFVEDDFNELLARMRGTAAPWQQIILTTNPDQPQHWIYKRLIQAGEAAVYYSGALDNIHNPPQYIDILNRMTGVLYDRLVLGKWIQAEGAVYGDFADEVHVLDELPDDPVMFYPRFIGSQDWGYTNAGVFHVWGVDGDGRMTLVDEIYKSRELIGWWTTKVKAKVDYYGIEGVACDPAEPAYIEQFQNAGIPAFQANNEIAPGIQRIQNRLKVAGDGKPRFFIYRGACAEPDTVLEAAKKPTSTLAEFPAYVWAKGADGKPNKEIPVDDNNHGCFIAGTQIQCDDGMKNIEDITTGDKVLTRNGFRPVIAAGMTQSHADIWRVEFSNDSSLTGTLDHPIYANGEYTALHALRYGDTIISLINAGGYHRWLLNAKSQILSIMMGMIIYVGRIPPIGQIVSITIQKGRLSEQGKSGSTGNYGKMPMVVFQKVMKFIIKMATRLTIPCLIWNVYRQKIIPNGTPKTFLKNAGNKRENILIPFDTWHQHGTNHQKAGSGILHWQNKCGQIGNPMNSSVYNAENLISRGMRGILSFAQMPVNLHGDELLAWTTKHVNASIAGNLLKRIAIAKSKPVPVHVVRVFPLHERKPVYNLTVANTPGEYFANGVLVHNCDAARYACAYLDEHDGVFSFRL